MDKLDKKIKRLVLSLSLMITGVFVVAGEAVYLNGQTTSIGSVLGVWEESSSGDLLVGEDNNVGDEIKVKEEISSEDARPVIIRKYLEKYKSPLLPYSDLIYQISKDYGFEYYWIVAIAQQESNLCKKAPEDSHNCWGYGIHKRGTLKFENYELAIKSYADYLKREYFDKGLNTPELIMQKYCPS